MRSDPRSDGPASRGAILRALVVCAVGLLTGCAAPPRVAAPLTAGPLAGNEPGQRSEFWYQLARRPAVSNDEAFHALLLYFADADPAAGYAGRVTALRARGMLPAGFDRPADEAIDRGTVAYAVAQGAGIRGGVTMRLLGASGRYADRALQYRGVLPAGSPNQVLTGGQFVAVIGRVEDLQRGDPAEARAALLPGEIKAGAAAPTESDPAAQGRDVAAPPTDDDPAAAAQPVLLNVIPGRADLWWQDTQPAAGGAAAASRPTAARPAKLKAIITGVEGDAAEIRKTPADPWVRARVGQSLTEGGEFRTGPKSAIRFVIPPDQVYTLDRQGTCSVIQAVYDGKRVTADVGMDQGRVRLDVAPIAAPPKPADPADAGYQFNQAGVEHGITIRSPNAALAVSGTLVSLYDEPGFDPAAVSLTGRAMFRNTKRQVVAFGGASGRTTVRGGQTAAAEESLEAATRSPNVAVSSADFDNRQTALLLDRGGLRRGDVLTGNSRVTNAELVPTLPGALNFVLRWDGGPARTLNDLNIVVFSPLHTAASPDFVGNPPFTLSLTPGDPTAERTRSQFYPRTSRSGGRISGNHVGPEGLEFATWPKGYPAGDYRVVVYNLLDAVPPPPTTVDPVSYTLDVFLNKRVLIQTVTGSVGELQIGPTVVVPVPAPTAGTTAQPAAAAPRVAGPTRATATKHPKRR